MKLLHVIQFLTVIFLVAAFLAILVPDVRGIVLVGGGVASVFVAFLYDPAAGKEL